MADDLTRTAPMEVETSGMATGKESDEGAAKRCLVDVLAEAEEELRKVFAETGSARNSDVGTCMRTNDRAHNDNDISQLSRHSFLYSQKNPLRSFFLYHAVLFYFISFQFLFVCSFILFLFLFSFFSFFFPPPILLSLSRSLVGLSHRSQLGKGEYPSKT